MVFPYSAVLAQTVTSQSEGDASSEKKTAQDSSFAEVEKTIQKRQDKMDKLNNEYNGISAGINMAGNIIGGETGAWAAMAGQAANIYAHSESIGYAERQEQQKRALEGNKESENGNSKGGYKPSLGLGDAVVVAGALATGNTDGLVQYAATKGLDYMTGGVASGVMSGVNSLTNFGDDPVKSMQNLTQLGSTYTSGATSAALGSAGNYLSVIGVILGEKISESMTYRSWGQNGKYQCTADLDTPTIDETTNITCTGIPLAANTIIVPPQLTFSDTPSSGGKVTKVGAGVSMTYHGGRHPWWEILPIGLEIEYNVYEGDTMMADGYYSSFDGLYDSEVQTSFDINNSEWDYLKGFTWGNTDLSGIDIPFSSGSGVISDAVAEYTFNGTKNNTSVQNSYGNYGTGISGAGVDYADSFNGFYNSLDGNSYGGGSYDPVSGSGYGYGNGYGDYGNGGSWNGSGGSNANGNGGSWNGSDGSDANGNGGSWNGSGNNGSYDPVSGSGYGNGGSWDGSDGSGIYGNGSNGYGYGYGDSNGNGSSYSSANSDWINGDSSSYNAGADDWMGSDNELDSGMSSSDLNNYFGDSNYSSNSYNGISEDLTGMDNMGIFDQALNPKTVNDIINAGGYIDDNGDIYDAKGNKIGNVSEAGLGVFQEGSEALERILANGGYVDENGYVYDANGKLLGKVSSAGNAEFAMGSPELEKILAAGGWIDEFGNVHDASGRIVGHVTSATAAAHEYQNYLDDQSTMDKFLANLQSMFANASGENSLTDDLSGKNTDNVIEKLKATFGLGDSASVLKETMTPQEMYDSAAKLLKALGYTDADIAKGLNYDKDSAYTQPETAWDMNRITTLQKNFKIDTKIDKKDVRQSLGNSTMKFKTVQGK